MTETRTTIDIRPPCVERNTKSPLKLLLDTLLRNRHQIRCPQYLPDLGQQRIVTRQPCQVGHFHFLLARAGSEELASAELALPVLPHRFRRRKRHATLAVVYGHQTTRSLVRVATERVPDRRRWAARSAPATVLGHGRV